MIKKQLPRFIVIGIFSTIINYSFFYILLTYLSINYMIASAGGFFLGVFAGYTFNKSWTFEVQEKSSKKLIQYYIVYILSLAFGLVLLNIMVEWLGILPQIANILSSIEIICTNFIGIKFWVFRKKVISIDEF